MPKPLTIAERLQRFPPLVCRLLARRHDPSRGIVPLSTAEIAQRSGLTVSEVASLAPLTSWDTVPTPRALAFSKACGIDLDDRDSLRHHSAYMKRFKGAPRYLVRSPDWATVYAPLIQIWEGANTEAAQT
jgi:hypothetical protein